MNADTRAIATGIDTLRAALLTELGAAISGMDIDSLITALTPAIEAAVVNTQTNIAADLRLCADGRDDYGSRAPEPDATNLAREAQGLRNAAEIAEGDPFTFKAMLPSRRWDEIPAHLNI